MTDTRDVERHKMLDRMQLDADARLLATLSATIFTGYLATHTGLPGTNATRELRDMAMQDAIAIWTEAMLLMTDRQPEPPAS